LNPCLEPISKAPQQSVQQPLSPVGRWPESKLDLQMRHDLHTLLEAFVNTQKADAPWLPVRQPVARRVVPPALIGLSPVRPRASVSPTHRWSPKRASASPTRSRCDVWGMGDHSGFHSMTVACGRVPAERFPVSSAPNFETVVRTYFITATEAEISAMLSIAESVVAWRRAEHDRLRWVQQTRISLADSIRRAFQAECGVSQGGKTRPVCGLLSVRTFAEAVSLRRQVVAGLLDPEIFRVANLRNLRLLADLNRSEIAEDDAELGEIVHAADLSGKVSVDDLLDLVSHQESLRSELEEITLLGLARRYNRMNGYWRASQESQSKLAHGQIKPVKSQSKVVHGQSKLAHSHSKLAYGQLSSTATLSKLPPTNTRTRLRRHRLDMHLDHSLSMPALRVRCQ